MNKWNIALGFYNEKTTADHVLKELKRSKFHRVTSIFRQKDGIIKIERNLSIFPIDKKTIDRFTNLVLVNEILILVEIGKKDIRECLSILRDVKSGHPVSFLLRSHLMDMDPVEIASEPLTLDLLKECAIASSFKMKDVYIDKVVDKRLKKHLHESNIILQVLHSDILDAEKIEQSIPVSAEWLMDNMYMIEGAIEYIHQNFPDKFYRELPKLVSGSNAGLPRIYAIAIELVKGTAGSLTSENIIEFLKNFQIDNPLTICELWAFPLMLRFRIVEWIRGLAFHIDKRMREGELASFWGNRLLYASRYEVDRLPLILEALANEIKAPSAHFAEEVIDHLFDEERVVPHVRTWLETCFQSPLEEVLHKDQVNETAEQVVISNLVRSLITLSQISWPVVLEAVSTVDVILREDPLGYYSKMDLSTRNLYRKAIEEIARRSNFLELDVVKEAKVLALKGRNDVEKHIGYYLVDDGREILEKKVGYHPYFLQSIRRFITRYGTSIYLGGLLLSIVFFEVVLIGILYKSEVTWPFILLFSLFSLLPFSEIAIQMMNFIIFLILPAKVFPKMSYESGVPKEYKTLVVIPMMLLTPDSIKEEIHRLEIRYLANTDPALCFALFSDYSDAISENTLNDASLLEIARQGILHLSDKYKAGKFFLFHRTRKWCRSENAWIGWERKRGKIEILNCFLAGENLEENILYVGKKEDLKEINYVITLDADTQLNKDQARSLIEVISHPLNKARLNTDQETITRGFTLIQPRVVTDFSHSKVSWFCYIFSEPAALDPYTQAVSDIYQDLTGEGTYFGKGIYDVKAFHKILSHRFPEEHLLSHDLIEGAHVRVGFASNICLYDLHPGDYFSWIKRKHRWMRGDWQIMDWLFSFVPSKNFKKTNTLSAINRWKIFDNLRRAMLPVFCLTLLLIIWMFSKCSWICTALVGFVLILPCISLFIDKIVHFNFQNLSSFIIQLTKLFARSLIMIALLPYEAYLSLDALFRVIYRRLFSHQLLLEWTTVDNNNHSSEKNCGFFLYKLAFVPIFSILIFSLVRLFNSSELIMTLPFCILWLLSPFIVYLTSFPFEKKNDRKISSEDKNFLRKIARKTWRYYDDFVGPQTNFLPPDNYQAYLNVEVAMRTSPTNIGMWLMAVMSAYDFRYITCDEVIDKVRETIASLKKLERYEGHFLNWYNINNLEPLYPKYISTVDSGNLLACFWALKEGLNELIEAPIIPLDSEVGLEIMDQILKEKADEYWIKKIEEHEEFKNQLSSRYFSWKKILESLSIKDLNILDVKAFEWREKALSYSPSLIQLATGSISKEFQFLIDSSEKKELPKEIKAWGKFLKEALSKAQWLAGEKIGEVKELIRVIEQISKEINLTYLFNKERKLFSIGYNVSDKRLDSSYYDLLASEARIASLVAIAKEDVPLEHWWALGRLYNNVYGYKVLFSWGGTMFEYLMPLIFNKQYPDSLLGSTAKSAVAIQIKYGNQRGIPWGISESAYSAIDIHKIYQYKSFGVPGLGLKRGLEADLVVSPYSTGLGLLVDAPAAIKNFRNMTGINDSLLGQYGYFESIDFTRQSRSSGERGVIVQTFMAHHQGMILTAINNVLNDDAIIRRFQKDPRIAGVTSLLYECVPSTFSLQKKGFKKEARPERLKSFPISPIMGVVETPDSVTPKVNLLSNENYCVMITNTGGGYSRWKDIDITRWRADTTQDNWGSYCYIKDIKSGKVWSTFFQPTESRGIDYSVNFKGDKAEFRRTDNKIETLTEILVSPEDDAEVRLLTLINHSKDIREIELTSYMELVLAPHATDRSHPCFNKLFIETEAVPECSGLLAFRRLRSPEDKPIWVGHLVAANQMDKEEFQYETDRSKFIGRGNSYNNPSSLYGNLSNTVGTVLDPIFSLRKRIILEPGKRVQVSFITVISNNREMTLSLMEKYKDIGASQRVIELSWTYSQLEIRHLRIHQEEVQLFQKLASRILYPHSQLRIVEERIRNNKLNQTGLWAEGISGDMPIVVVTVGDMYDVDLVRQVLVAHYFWNLRGLKVDLVILNEEEAGYFQPLEEDLQLMIRAFAFRNQVEVPGGVFLRNKNKLSEDSLNLLLSIARVVLIAARGFLRQQLVSPRKKDTYSLPFKKNEKIKEEPSKPLPFLELSFFNGFGGYANEGKEYVIYLGSNTNTPAPWINVLANEKFGCLVSERGLGVTWFKNSQLNRLTPWSNDPVLDPITDAIYIRDEELGAIWTATPAPIRELDPYRITHTQGFSKFEHSSHGILQELIIFVPQNEEGGLPIRIQRLRLKNESSRQRKLLVTSYSEWVLGTNKEETQTNVFTEWDAESQAIFAYNRLNIDFGKCVAFSGAFNDIASYTGDRTEFLGRNHSTHSPEALKRQFLSGRVGAAIDPCAALQVFVELNPGEEKEVVFLMGYCAEVVGARELLLKCRKENEIARLFLETKEWWNKNLSCIQVKIPDKESQFLINSWLPYQNLACRFWARTAFYQSSGAFGFRDQLQDSMALLYSIPKVARAYILKAASRQFIEGDVQHWWHEPSGGGVRTRFSDDLLWLPFVVAQYVRVTGDVSILSEEIPFLISPVLTENQHEEYQVPNISEESASLLEHCRRSLKKGMTAGVHGLPLIGGGDWNDGMNRVGIEGKGESVWLAWFLIHVMNDFADLLVLSSGNEETSGGFRLEAKRLKEVIEASAWDGFWYRRAYYDNGSPLGSNESLEAKIDSLAQSWAVISGHGDPNRIAIAFKALEERLIKNKENLMLLLTPPFDKTLEDPGYIKGYPPGVRENGGQYTHGSLWVAMAYARQGKGEKAAQLLRMMSPIAHTETEEANIKYKLEPYVVAADIYDLKSQVGRGGWSWYTGSAAWLYRIWLEEVLGFKLRGGKLYIEPVIPAAWDEYTIEYRYKTSVYIIKILNPTHVSCGEIKIKLDGTLLPKNEIFLEDDGKTHTIEAIFL